LEIARFRQVPCYAVIFNSVLKDNADGYEQMADRMVELARKQPGFLGFESLRDDIGITISYWKDPQSIKKWKEHSEHVIAQEKGKNQWYSSYVLRICKVERQYYSDGE